MCFRARKSTRFSPKETSDRQTGQTDRAEMAQNFRFANQRAMLTYRTHIPKEELIATINGVWPAVFCRAAHETGKHEDETEAYPHTHVLVDFGRARQSRNPRVFDFGLIHPHIRPVKSVTHWKNELIYIAKEDTANADLLAMAQQTAAERVWGAESLQDALRSASMKDVLPTIALYNARPDEEYRAPVPEAWRPWQQNIIDILEGPVNDRQIIWILDPKGGSGKSVLARYIEDYMNGIMLTQMGGAKDTATILQGAKPLSDRPIVIDLPRQAEMKEIYSPIEMIKNGRMTVVKYTGGMLRWRPGHVVVMANFPPNMTAWSPDRYRIIELKGTESVPGLTLRSPAPSAI